jgi:mRNA interferase MazF
MPAQPKRSEIWMVNLGEDTKVVGSEQARVRPCIIVRPVDHIKLALIIPLTTKYHPSLDFCCTLLHASPGGLNADGYAMCHQTRTVSYLRLSHRLGALPARDFGRVLTTLADFIDL